MRNGALNSVEADTILGKITRDFKDLLKKEMIKAGLDPEKDKVSFTFPCGTRPDKEMGVTLQHEKHEREAGHYEIDASIKPGED